MQSLSRNTFTINLVSNASMTTFPESSLAHFTTLLPEEMQLQGTWEVAVVEISWSNLIKNVTEGKFTVKKSRHLPLKRARENDIHIEVTHQDL